MAAGILNADLVGSERIRGLWVGGFNAPRSTERLAATGITHILSAAREFPPPTHLSWMHLTLNDETHWDLLSLLPQTLPWIHSALTSDPGHQVLVHCAHGSSRSGSIAVAYLMWQLDLSFDDALALAQQSRSKIQPNPGFEDQLRYWRSACNCDLTALQNQDDATKAFLASYRKKADITRGSPPSDDDQKA